ncbi:MAG TPA: hypothetical protein VHO07_00070, partial [Streptosporangiaceae bacterium]|nr:hypothetical protein [Streptosporangiaceae bacterium]
SPSSKPSATPSPWNQQPLNSPPIPHPAPLTLRRVLPPAQLRSIHVSGAPGRPAPRHHQLATALTLAAFAASFVVPAIRARTPPVAGTRPKNDAKTDADADKSVS